jgi:hypothetical protein
MATQVVSRETESRMVGDFLASLPSGPAALVVEGEAGIGKTTVWLAALERAEGVGYRVLSARATPAEPVLAYSSLAALLAPLDDSAFAELPQPQRLAIDRVLMRVSTDGPVTDQRAVGAAFASVVERLAAHSPVLLAIDDLQWLDPASMLIISSVMRRLTGPTGVLVTVRDEPEHAGAAAWLELRRPDRLQRVHVRPLSMGATHRVLFERLGRSFSRPKIRRIHELSGGNPFYALELGRAIDDDPWVEGTALPTSLADLVRARLAALTVESRDALLAAACLAAPTLELIARANNTDAERVVAILEEAENNGIVQIDGNRVAFTHPLMTRGAYNDAPRARRRAMHRRLAEIVEEPERKARHLALTATRGDQVTLRALDAAAETVRIRGAPAAAAELLDLARGLGGDTPERRMPETHTLGENTNPNPISVDIGPAQIEEPSPVVVDIGPAQIEPEQTVGEQAQNAGIDSSSGAADFGGMAAEGPATPSYDPGPYGGLGAEGPADGSGQGGDFGGLGAAGPVGGSDEGYDIF